MGTMQAMESDSNAIKVFINRNVPSTQVQKVADLIASRERFNPNLNGVTITLAWDDMTYVKSATGQYDKNAADLFNAVQEALR